MGLQLLVKDGPRKGDQFRLLEGLTIGRSRTDISLRDPKASSLHARIELSPKGQFVLVDQGSANGVWVGDEAISRLELVPGTVFRIGTSVLEVVDDLSLELDEAEANTWQARLWAYFRTLSSDGKFKADTRAAIFKSPLQLSFVKGPMKGTELVITFGPRTVGRDSADIALRDTSAPAVAFRIVPDEKSLFIMCESPRVKLNGKSFSSEKINSGDVVSFDNSEITLHELS